MNSSAPRLEQTIQRFDALALGYDQVGFLRQAAELFARSLPVTAGQQVLDLATGTGRIAAVLCERGARVTGLDLSESMLGVARQQVPKARFICADAATLPLPSEHFDWVVCGAGLFFMSDLPAALREWRRVLKTGGTLAFSTFGPGLLGALPQLWQQRLSQYDLKAPRPPLGRIPSPHAAYELLRDTPFEQLQVQLEPLSYLLPNPEARWRDIRHGLEGEPLRQLPAQTSRTLRREHLAELSLLFKPEGLRVPLPLIVASGRKGA